MQALQLHFPADLLVDDAGANRVLNNFEFLGAAVGEDSYVCAHTLLSARPRPVSCWTPWRSWRIRKLACGSCEHALGFHVWFIV